MNNQKTIIITNDSFLKYSIEKLMQYSFNKNIDCFIDVDSFNSIQELSHSLKLLSQYKSSRVLLISRGLWLSRVIASFIDVSLYDDISAWRRCVTQSHFQSLAQVIERIDRIKGFEMLTMHEAKIIPCLCLMTNLHAAAEISGVSYKNFLNKTITVARKLNLKNTVDLHFFIYKFIR
jgi:hypothetical protein